MADDRYGASRGDRRPRVARPGRLVDRRAAVQGARRVRLHRDGLALDGVHACSVLTEQDGGGVAAGTGADRPGGVAVDAATAADTRRRAVGTGDGVDLRRPPVAV